MNSTSRTRHLLTALAALLILSACSSDDDSTAAEATTTTAVEETTTSTTEAVTAENELQAPLPSIDDRTPEEVAIDQIDVMALQLGIPSAELEAVVDCTVERFEAEGAELTGEGLPPLIALTGCEPSVASEWLPPENPALPPQIWACTVESIGQFLSNGQTIAEGEAFLTAESPPDEFLDQASADCGIDRDSIAAALAG